MSQLPDVLIINARAQERFLRSICHAVESLIDVVCIVAALPLAAFLYQHLVLRITPAYNGHVVFGLLVAVGYLCVHRVLSQHNKLRGDGPGEAILRWSIAYVLAIGFSFWLKLTTDLSRMTLLAGFVLTPFMLLGCNRAFRGMLKRAGQSGALPLRRAGVISIATRGLSPQLRELLLDQGAVVAFEGATNGASETELSSLVKAAMRSGANQLFLIGGWEHFALSGALRAACAGLDCPIYFVPTQAGMTIVGARRIGRASFYEVRTAPLSEGSLMIKRALDICISALAIFFLWPLLAAVAFAVLIETKDNPIFRQRRRGLNGVEFVIFKFRTMTVREDGQIVRQAQRNDPRVTRLGRVLRRTSLDELPQLFNVLFGSMSLVGPRPHAVAHDEFYGAYIDNYALRHRVKPGITGWAQINGHRGETPDIDDMRRRCEHDVWYSENWSVMLDVAILVRTATCVWASERAY